MLEEYRDNEEAGDVVIVPSFTKHLRKWFLVGQPLMSITSGLVRKLVV